jgi:hypothetical protein
MLGRLEFCLFFLYHSLFLLHLDSIPFPDQLVAIGDEGKGAK